MTAGRRDDDDGEARYTAVFTGLLNLREPGEYPYVRFGGDGSREETRRGRPPYGELGEEVSFGELPEAVRAEVLRRYREMWDL